MNAASPKNTRVGTIGAVSASASAQFHFVNEIIFGRDDLDMPDEIEPGCFKRSKSGEMKAAADNQGERAVILTS